MTKQPKVTDRPREDGPVRRLAVSENGRVLIPAEMRAALGVRSGGSVIAKMEGDKLVLEPLSSTLSRIRKWTQSLAEPDESLVDELISDRRRDAARE